MQYMLICNLLFYLVICCIFSFSKDIIFLKIHSFIIIIINIIIIIILAAPRGLRDL